MEASTSNRKKRRKKAVHECPNPLFEKWLTTWKEEAITKGWKTQHTYAKALRSLQRYPLPLQSGKEAKILDNFGDKLCKMLDDKLIEHKNVPYALECESDELPSVIPPSSNRYTAIVAKKDENDLTSTEEPTKKKRKIPNRKYIPAPRTGGHALLITLLKHEIDKDEMSVQKKVLIESAQPVCDASFTVPEPGSYYTAWSMMSTLIKKGLIIKSSHPPMFSLTDAGRELAITLIETDRAIANEAEIPKEELSSKYKSSTNGNRIIAENNVPSRLKKKYTSIAESETAINRMTQYNKEMSDTSASHTNIPETVLHSGASTSFDATGKIQSETVIFNPGTFDIILCVDNCEVYTGSSKSYKMAIFSELKDLGVKYDVRKLHVGDFLWIAKSRIENGVLANKELVLDYVVERKRMDDLAQSIKDGRYREQKFRLRNCGIRKPIYLIEEYLSNQCFGIPEASLNQAIINTQIIDGFLVKRTKNIKASVRYLTLMTRYLQSVYNQKMLVSRKKDGDSNSNTPFTFMLFDEFNLSAMKNKQLTVTEMFAKHLLQLKGLSVDKAISIVEKYPTPAKLLQAYNTHESSVEKEKLLEDIKYGRNKRRIGTVVSKTLCRLYCTERFSELKS